MTLNTLTLGDVGLVQRPVTWDDNDNDDDDHHDSDITHRNTD